ncbi:MAG: M3 family metallopeptidase [Mariprofundaceae bacterium]
MSRPEAQAVNPLTEAAEHPRPPFGLPDFARIRPEHALPALREALTQARAMLRDIERRLDEEPADWDNLMAPLAAIDDRIERIWGPVSHLNAVMDSDELRPVYQQGLVLLTEWQNELAANATIWHGIRSLRESEAFPHLNAERRRVVELACRDWRLAGADLKGAARRRFDEIQLRLSELATVFEQHVLDATRAWTLHLDDEADLAGLPDSVRTAAAARAREAGKTGWLFTLDAPSWLPFMQYAENRELRRQMYHAYVTRASGGERDNAPVIREILQLRREAARLLGFANHAEYSLASKMAASPEEVIAFLRDLAAKSRPHAERELAELRAFARDELGLASIEAWDVPFASERLRQARYAISQEELKPYFSEPQVIEGLFGLAERLYGVVIREADAPRWHPDARFYEIRDAGGDRIAGFWLDPYARPRKRGGAWMDECIVRWCRPDGSLQRPVAYLVCNFERPVNGRPALWTHEEVLTLFHEFGHGLHHMLTEVCEPAISGIRGVPWDAVELPSQFMENFCWEREVLDMFARHVDTGEPLPQAMFERMRAARDFQAGMQMLRQIEFALFDMLLHGAFDPDGGESPHDVLERVREEVAVLRPPAFNRFENSFSHIFAGGYSAGYYSYKWAEVLSADAFSAFEEEGVLNRSTAERFRRELLAVGGSRDLMEAFVAFRGRKPSVEPLLRHSGLLD